MIDDYICNKCGCELEEMDANISYLGRNFVHKVPRCPSCGQVFISRELAEGKMTEIEKALEEK